MDFFTQPEITQSFNWFCNVQPQQNDTDKIMGIAPFDDFFEFDWATQFSYQSNHFYMNDFDDLENFNFDFNLPHLDQNNFEVDKKPLNVVLPELGHYNHKGETVGYVEASVKTESGFVSFVKKENEWENQELSSLVPLALQSSSTSIIRKRSSSLQFDDIKKHFDVPITMAAKKLNVGVTFLKKRCRELNITRWPHRKLRSLMLLIDNLKDKGLTKEVAMLEKQKKMLEKLPGMHLNDEIKKLRQACFKANYKNRKLIALCP
ncbi:putative transcription factor Nin-like family [Medicago truncatula]|uniref:Putative transcription factor Nin-like family n=1 Tax=Medicago truncatula TaxID=3880 RepID=G7J7G0_MEDTR|nr:protein RKD4 [Medicago truncatula]AES72521.1 RWP-RK domain protein [Medicago truncatula]RHN69646.1 putative transcription factor Nin-like family [Medicago truncatula]